MSGAHAATSWATVLVDELHRAGLRDVCLAPGSRSTPVVLAAARHGGFRLRVFIDERSAGFFALGLGKATGRPAAVLTTSGTAVANLHPAVLEASLSETPLLLLTADRPPTLRGADANQTVDQPHIFGGAVRLGLDLPVPSTDEPALRHLREIADRAMAEAGEGPVHLNLPFDKPLEPPADGPAPDAAVGGARESGEPRVRIRRARPRATADDVTWVERMFAEARRPMVVAGPHPEAPRLGPALRRACARLGCPLLADPLSGARYAEGRGDAVVSSYDLLARWPEVREALAPDLVVRVGRSPTSAPLLRWLDELEETRQIVVDAGGRWKDHLHRATDYLTADPVDLFDRLYDRLRDQEPGPWLRAWTRLDRAAMVPAGDHEGAVLASIAAALPEGTPLFVSSSMPVRDLDTFGPARDTAVPVFGNRGASGIDGIVSTALGVAAGAGRTAVAVLGDLAFLHDVNGLLAAREADASVVFVVIDNDGGGIFHLLPVREQEPEFTPYFATPHGLDLAHGAALYGVPYRRLEGDPGAAVAEALAAGGSTVLEVKSDRETNRRGHEAAVTAARRAVLDALNDDSTKRES